jgi:hypothetical protein
MIFFIAAYIRRGLARHRALLELFVRELGCGHHSIVARKVYDAVPRAKTLTFDAKVPCRHRDSIVNPIPGYAEQQGLDSRGPRTPRYPKCRCGGELCGHVLVELFRCWSFNLHSTAHGPLSQSA